MIVFLFSVPIGPNQVLFPLPFLYCITLTLKMEVAIPTKRWYSPARLHGIANTQDYNMNVLIVLKERSAVSAVYSEFQMKSAKRR
jgi:hypothetical protein